MSDTRCCLVWQISRPNKDEEHKSLRFHVYGGVYCLKFRAYAKGRFYRLFFQHLSGKLHDDKNFSITTFVEKKIPNTMAVLSAVTAATSVNISKTLELWCFNEAEISVYVPGFQDGSEFKIVVFFQDTQNCALHSRKKRIVLSAEDHFNHPVGSGRGSSCLPKGKQSSDKSAQVSLDFPEDLQSMSMDFFRLFDSKAVADVKLKWITPAHLITPHSPLITPCITPAHLAVSAARSQAFAAEFQNDIETSVLKYLFSGTLPSLPEDALSNLCVAASEYAVQTLKKACTERMIKILNEVNCLDFLILAYVHGDHRLKGEVTKFIIQHMGVLRSQAWTGFEEEHPNLAVDVYRMFVFQKHFSVEKLSK